MLVVVVLCRYDRGDCMMVSPSKQQSDSQPTTHVDVKRPKEPTTLRRTMLCQFRPVKCQWMKLSFDDFMAIDNKLVIQRAFYHFHCMEMHVC